MANGKKSFVLYADLLKSVDHLTDEELGKLFKHILLYVNDEAPVLEDRLLVTAWKPIERSLKEDLIKWEETRKARAEAGRKGGKAKQANARIAKQNLANQAVSVTVTDTVSDNVKEKNSIEVRKQEFANELRHHVDKYGKAMITEFYEYWTEPNQRKTKMKYEMQKTWSLSRRLSTWATNSAQFGGAQPKDKKDKFNPYG